MTGTFISQGGKTYTVTVGAAEGTLILGEDPVHISWPKATHLFAPVRTSECSIRVKTSVDLSSLYTDEPLGCPVTVYQGSTCLFMGYLTPQVWDAPYRGVLDEVELIAVDAIAALKNIRFTYASTSPRLVTPADLVGRAIAAAGVTRTNITHPYTQQNINEEAFLPKNWDASEYSDERKTWAEVLEAVGTWEMLTFWLIGDILYGRSVETLLSRTPEVLDLRGEDSAGTDVRLSIEPARSRVQVSYDNLNQMALVPNIDEERFDGSPLSNSTTGSSETVTYAEYFVAKDWTPTDSRSGCAAVVYDADKEETPCIVGPAYIKVVARHYNTRVSDNRGIRFSMQAWARNDMTVNADGFEELAVHTSPSNFNPTIVLGSDETSVSKQLQIEGQEGFASCSASVFPNDSADFAGVINVTIPEHCAIANLKVEFKERAYNSTLGKWEKLSDVPNDGIVVLKSSGFNDVLNISATLRACANAWAAGDVPGDVALGWDKFPFCKTEQYAIPRKRFTATVSTPSNFAQYDPVADTYVSTQKLFVDGADYDLRSERVTLNLLETWVAVP